MPYKIVSVRIEPNGGSKIDTVIREAAQLSADMRAPVEFTFNGRELRVDAEMSIRAALNDYQRQVNADV